jgi:hypothetical protein
MATFFWGCAKKTHTLDNAKVSKQTKSSNDSTGQKKIEIYDKSILLTVRDIDTTIITTGKPLTGYIDKGDTTSNYFENDDISLYLETSKKTGQTKAIVTPKSKKVAVRIHESVTTHTDIHSVESEKSNLKIRIKAVTDSTSKHVVDHTDPIAINNIKKIIIGLIVLIIVAGLIFYLVKKFSVTGLITGWLKKLL